MSEEEITTSYGKYILDENKNPVLVKDLMTWAKWIEENFKERILKQEYVTVNDTRYFVSTVFLSLDYSHRENSNPILWETMIFAENKDGEKETFLDYQTHYHTKEEALSGHEEAVKFVKNLAK